MTYFYNEEQERRFNCYPEWKQKMIMDYAKEHDAVIGFKSDWSWKVQYLFHYHYDSDWRYGRDGYNVLETMFLLPDNTVTNGLCVVYPDSPIEQIYNHIIQRAKEIQMEWGG